MSDLKKRAQEKAVKFNQFHRDKRFIISTAPKERTPVYDGNKMDALYQAEYQKWIGGNWVSCGRVSYSGALKLMDKLGVGDEPSRKKQ